MKLIQLTRPDGKAVCINADMVVGVAEIVESVDNPLAHSVLHCSSDLRFQVKETVAEVVDMIMSA